MDGATLPLNAAILRNKSAVRDDLRVSTVTTSFLPFERSAPIPVCVYKYITSHLAEAFYGQPRDTLLERRIPTEEDQFKIGALLPLRTSERAIALMEMTPYD
jgi:hypothetical protein